MNTESPILQIEAAWAVCNAINGGTVEQVGGGERESEEQIRYIVGKHVISPLIRVLSQTIKISLVKNILISLNRILKVKTGEDCDEQVGNHVQKHCQLTDNPYFVTFNDAGGVDRVLEIQSVSDPEIKEICEHILRYCEMNEEDLEALLPKIQFVLLGVLCLF